MRLPKHAPVLIILMIGAAMFGTWVSVPGQRPDQAATAPGLSISQDVPPLADNVILTVGGLDPARFPDGTLALDQDRLKSLGEVRFNTTTIWTDGVHEFSGVLLRDLVAFLQLGPDARFLAQALNDYSVEIPVSDAVAGGPVLAMAIDGAPLSIRDMGPIWIVYPYDQKPEYRSEVIYTRSIWQLVHLEVLD